MAGAWALLAATTRPVLAGLALAMYGFAAVWWNVVTASFRQAVIPERLQGRVNSAYRLANSGATSLGATAGGVVAAALGLRAVYAGAAAVVALLAVILWWRLDAAAFAAARQAAQAELLCELAGGWNPQPAVYKTPENGPPGTGGCCPCSSRQIGHPARSLLSAPVLADGMTVRMTATRGVS
jgi:hypothetical protein